MSVNLVKGATEVALSVGTTQCTCRDCLERCTTAVNGGWTLCWECLEAGCAPFPARTGEWHSRRPEGDYECQRPAVAAQSGYTPCACRDCMDIATSSDVTQPGLCAPCWDAGCEAYRPGDSDYELLPHYMRECQRDDAYGA